MGLDAAGEQSQRGERARLEVGRVSRAHGLRGEVVVRLTTDRLERVRPGAELFAGERRLVVEASRSHRDSHIVRFAGVVGRDAAEAMRGEVLSAEPLDAPGVLWVHELIGASVVDRAGSPLGTVGAVEANPASDLLVLEGGGLIPLAFVVAGPDEGVVVVDPPPGLLDA